MKDLYEAIGIFMKYTNTEFPTWCRHDELHICVEPDEVSDEDKVRLNELGFFVTDEEGDNEFMSFKFGSC